MVGAVLYPVIQGSQTFCVGAVLPLDLAALHCIFCIQLTGEGGENEDDFMEVSWARPGVVYGTSADSPLSRTQSQATTNCTGGQKCC